MTDADTKRLDTLVTACREQARRMERLHETLIEVAFHRRGSAALRLARLAERVEAEALGEPPPPRLRVVR